MPEIKDTAEFAADAAADNAAPVAEFTDDPAEEVAANGQKAAQGEPDAEDGPTAAEVESAAQVKAAAIAQAEKELADAKAAGEKAEAEKAAAAKAPEPDAEFGPKVNEPVIETQDHPHHPSRHHPAARPCPAGP